MRRSAKRAHHYRWAYHYLIDDDNKGREEVQKIAAFTERLFIGARDMVIVLTSSRGEEGDNYGGREFAGGPERVLPILGTETSLKPGLCGVGVRIITTKYIGWHGCSNLGKDKDCGVIPRVRHGRLPNKDTGIGKAIPVRKLLRAEYESS
ncbi:hypothetical protein BDZ91DRAFT_797725 [Kalaharituber pfeilii]|nr:hypothetical protein BDZ91DRAFT_797725 [Kalaharituber pfeilii]